jgi:hypothetical protein
MSELLEQAIVDAEALKEAALKNAEQAVIEKYSSEVKNTVEKLLEQPAPEDMEQLLGLGGGAPAGDPMAMGMDPMAMGMEAPMPPEEGPLSAIPMAHGDGEDLCPCPEEEKPLVVDLDAIEAMLLNQEGGGMGGIPEEFHEEMAEDVLMEDKEIEIDEAGLFADILETLKVDVDPSVNLLAPLGSNSTNLNMYEEEALALENDNTAELEEENEQLNEQYLQLEEVARNLHNTNTQLVESNEKTNESNSSLKEENGKIKSVLLQMKDRLDEVNLSNAKLLYMNRVLGSNSLNERQKTSIVESLSKADSIEGAKVLYETLQSSVGERKKSSPKSLSEAVNRNSSTTLARRDDVNPVDPVKDRWKKLAGLNN